MPDCRCIMNGHNQPCQGRVAQLNSKAPSIMLTLLSGAALPLASAGLLPMRTWCGLTCGLWTSRRVVSCPWCCPLPPTPLTLCWPTAHQKTSQSW